MKPLAIQPCDFFHTLHELGKLLKFHPNEAPRSKLRGITEFNFEDFSEAEANPVASYGESQVERQDLSSDVGQLAISLFDALHIPSQLFPRAKPP
jgi:hypothetical protein